MCLGLLSEESVDPHTPPVRTSHRVQREAQVNPYIRENKKDPRGYDMGIEEIVKDAIKKPEPRRTVWRRKNGVAVSRVAGAATHTTRKSKSSKPKYKMMNGVPVPV